MAKITVDGRELEFRPGQSIIEVSTEAGIEIPFYCWHPHLSVAANCRMCLVEVEKAPKLLPSCEVKCREGMVVHTKSEPVLEARRSVMEFLLINHPIDCPICDQAGECKLQDYYMKHDRTGTRFDEVKVPKKKTVPLGDTVMLDEERCINCTRCVRFMDEVAHNPVIGQFDRGDRAAIGVFPGQPLDDPYSLNVVDICPVGALTSRDFRFKVRSWFLKSTESVCPGCARGCNTTIDHYENEVQRLRPRRNDAVNASWLCDEGRFTYRSIHDPETKIVEPHMRADDGRLVPVSWEQAAGRLADLLEPYTGEADGTLGLVLSPQLTTEAVTAFVELAEQVLQVDTYALLGAPDDVADDILRVADRNPNRGGAELVLEAYSVFDEGESLLRRGLENGNVRTLLMVGGHHPDAGETWLNAFVRAKTVVFASEWNETSRLSELVIPLASYAEQDGTFVNLAGRMQRIRRALAPIGGRKTGVEAASWVAEVLNQGGNWRIRTWKDAFLRLRKQTSLLRDIDPDGIGADGVLLDARESTSRKVVPPPLSVKGAES
jgi:NADH-quinone oxidoreductase subunit G